MLCADFVSDVMRKRGITAHVLSYLWVDMVDDDLAKPTYDASCAGFGYSFRRLPRGAELQVVGYTNKLVAFIETVVQSILKDYSDSEDRFQVCGSLQCSHSPDTRTTFAVFWTCCCCPSPAA